MNPSTSLGTRSKVGMAKPSPPVRQAGNIGHLLVIRGVCRRSLPSACTHVKYRCRCRDSLVESLPTAQLLLLVNYRPEYQHGWGSKTYYTQLRLDSLPAVRADELLQALLGNDASLTPLTPLLIARTE